MFARAAFVVLFAVGLSAQSDQPPHAPSIQQGYRIAGVVVNWATGQPLAGASVAIAPTTQGTERDISRSVTTGADGRFAFAGLTVSYTHLDARVQIPHGEGSRARQHCSRSQGGLRPTLGHSRRPNLCIRFGEQSAVFWAAGTTAPLFNWAILNDKEKTDEYEYEG